MDLLGQSALVLAVTAFSLAITILSKNLRNKLSLAFAGLCTVVWGWAFFFALTKILGSDNYYRMHLTFNLCLAPTTLFFMRVFTRVYSRFSRIIWRISFVPLILFSPLIWIDFPYKILLYTLVSISPIFIGIEWGHLLYREYLLRRGELRSEGRPQNVGLSKRYWIYAGAFFVICTGFMDHAPFLGVVIPSLGNIFFSIYLFFISEAVSQQRLLNVTGLLNRVLVLVFLTLCIALIYILLVAWIQNSPGLFILNTFLASFIILMLIDPIKRLVSLGVMRIFYRQHLKTEQVVDEYQKQLTGVLDWVGLSQLSINLLEEILNVESATVFVLRSDGAKYRRIRGVRDDDLETREILATHPVIEFFFKMKRRGETPVALDTFVENEMERAVSQSLRQQYETVLIGLKGLNSNLLIPFISEHTVLGFMAVKSLNPPAPWGANWGILTVIYPFFTQAAQTLRNMDIYVKLREKDRLATLGEMSAGLAHEIRNPLAAIKGAAQLLVGAEANKVSPFTNVIVEEVNRLNKVVSQFLDYSRSQAPETVDYDIGIIIEKTAELFKTTPHPGIEIKVMPPEESYKKMPKIRCNPEQIKQILVNLLQNAISSVEARRKMEGPQAKPGNVEFGVRMSAGSKKEIIVFVEDNGLGIARDNLEKIFIPFFTTSPQGTGLGLAICNRIVSAHGGRTEVLSEEGKYARFNLYFPAESI